MPFKTYMRIPVLFACLMIFLISSLALVHAQSVGDTAAESLNADQMIEGWQAQLDQISNAVERASISREELDSFRERLIAIRNEAIDFSEKLTPELENLSGQLQKLTEAEKSTLVGDPTPASTEEAAQNEEPEATSEAASESKNETPQDVPAAEESNKPVSEAEQALNEDIAELDAQVTQFNAQLGRAAVVVLRSNELIDEISALRRTKFTDTLLERSQPLILPSLWISSIEEIGPFVKGLGAIWSSGSNRVLSEAPGLFFLTLFGGIALVVFLLKFFRPLRPVVPHQGGDEDNRSHAFYGKSGFNALQQVLRSLILFALVPVLIVLVLNQAGVLAERLSTLLWAVLGTVIYYAVARGLSRALIAPNMPSYRLLSMSDKAAHYSHNTIIICLTIALVGFLVVSFARTLVVSLDFTSLTYGIMSVSFAGVALYRYFTRPKEDGASIKLLSDILIIRIISIFVFVALLIALIAPFFGYPSLGAFSVGQVIIAGIIAVILYICFALIDGCLGTEVNRSEDGGITVIRASTVKDQRTIQWMMLLSGASKVILIFLGLGFFAASWGLDTTGIWDDLLGLFREIRIGEFTISPAVIVTSLLVLVIGILVTRSLQSWLSVHFLPTTALDVGLRNSIVTGMGYIGFIVAAMIAFSQAGLDLSNLAIVAGALSLGIGFGLQSIVSNFVSGIILLAERPIKAGDWIEVGGEEGTVRKINVRSTEIETFDRATVIVPNADFISGSVKNMMYGNKLGRCVVSIGVGYDSDPDEVREVLLEVAKEHPLILSYPEPRVVFMDFGASSLDFQLRGFIADCDNSLSVRSDLRFAIFRKLKQAGIEIPFPQRDVNIKGLASDEVNHLIKEEVSAKIKRPSKGRSPSSKMDSDAGDE